MTNQYYVPDSSNAARSGQTVRSAQFNDNNNTIEQGFDLLPVPMDLFSNRQNFGISTADVANVYEVSIAPTVLTSYQDGMQIEVRFPTANTGPAQLNLNSLGVKQIRTIQGQPVRDGDIIANASGGLRFDIANDWWQLDTALSTTQNFANQAAASAGEAATSAGQASQSASSAAQSASDADSDADRAEEAARVAQAGSVPLLQPRQVGDGTTTTFNAPHTIVIEPQGLHLNIDGLNQRPVTDYTTPNIGQVVFDEAPPIGAEIDITWFAPLVLSNPDLLVTAEGGTTPRALSTRFADVVNVKDFGAVGDGVADDIVAINAAIDFAAANGGGVIYFPAGVYAVSEHVHLRSFVTIEGQGSATTILALPSCSDNVIGQSGPEFDFDIMQPIIRNIKIDGNKTNVPFNTRGANGQTDDAFQNTVRLHKAKNFLIENVEIANSVMNALSVYFLSNNGVIRNCFLHDMGKAGTPTGFASYNGIFVEFASQNVAIKDCIIDTGREQGILVQTATEGGIDNLLIENCDIRNIFAQGIGIKDQGVGAIGPLFNIIIRGGRLFNCATNGNEAALRIEKLDTSTTTSNVLVEGLYVQDSRFIGVLINTRADACILRDVRVYGSTGRGIVLAGTDTELNGCISLSNGEANLDTSAAARTRIIGGQYVENGPSAGEQGVFTPTLSFGGNSVGVAYSLRSGWYRVNGDVIEFSLRVSITSKGTSVGQVMLGGLPYPVTDGNVFSTPTVTVSNVSYGDAVKALTLTGEDFVRLYNENTNAPLSDLTNVNVSDNAEFYVTGQYRVRV